MLIHEMCLIKNVIFNTSILRAATKYVLYRRYASSEQRLKTHTSKHVIISWA